jgi:CubicO group peptidase (beta-lactamase class C family)/photosystem II stability/assembly factor-like uncharacterized protein
MRVNFTIFLCSFLVYLAACKPAPETPAPTPILAPEMTATLAPTATILPPTSIPPSEITQTPNSPPPAEFVSADLEPSHLLEGGTILAILIDPQTPSTLYVLTYAGMVFKSMDGGENWKAANPVLSNLNFGTLAIDPAAPSTLYAATNGNGIFKSTDGGENWRTLNTGLITNEFTSLTIDPRQSNTLYVDAEDGLYKSMDGGENWRRVNPDLTHYAVDTLAIDPLTPSTLYLGRQGEVLKSTDGGVNWSTVSSGLSLRIHTLVTDPVLPGTLYAGTEEGVFKSTDGGQNWFLANNGMPKAVVLTLATDKKSPSTLYAGTSSEGVFKSTNYGKSWKAVNAGLTNSFVITLAIDPLNPSTLYAGTYGRGVFKSTDGGESWSTINTGLTGSVVSAIVIDPQTPTTLYAGTWGGGVYKSLNKGENWVAINAGLDDPRVMLLAADPLTPTTLYAGTEGGGFFKSMDGGESWSKINTGRPEISVNSLAIDPDHPATIYIRTGSQGIYKSTDGGVNWSPANNGLPEVYINSLAIDPANPSHLFAAISQDGVYQTSNGGDSWTAVNHSPYNFDILVVDPAEPGTLYAGRNDGVLMSADGGKTWERASTGITEFYFHGPISLAIDPQTPDTLYYMNNEGVFKSANGSKSWSLLNTGLANQAVTALAVDPRTPGTLLVGTWGGSVITLHTEGSLNPALESTPTILPPTPAPSPTLAPSQWQEAMEAFALDSLNNTPLAGMTLAIRRQGEPDWIRSYGYANLEEASLASADTIYPIGSLSMPFTAAAVMQLAERGQLDLNAPIGIYLEGLPVDLQSFSLRQLLDHSSKIYDPAVDFQDKFFGPQLFTSQTILQELVPNLQISSEEIGNHFSYGNYLLAGLIVEKASGLSFPDYLNQYVLGPAGLQHTCYCLPPPTGTAKTYYLPQGQLEPLQLNVSAAFAAGGLCSTAGDLLNWMDALSSGRVVFPETYQQMITPAQLPNGSPSNYGYGMFVFSDPYGLQVDSIGMEASYVSYLVAYPQKGLTIVWLSNTAKPDNNILETIWAFVPLLMP